MIRQYSNLISNDYLLKIVFFKISKDFIKRFKNISFNESFKVSIIEVDDKYAEQANYILGVESVRILNEELGGVIPIKVDGGPIPDIATAKLEG